jgi:phosphoribosylglycinamide formyltransferase-1
VAAFRVAVLISGEGTNLQALLDSVHGTPVIWEGRDAVGRPTDAGGPDRPDFIEVVGVASSRADAGGLRRATQAGVETAVFAVSDHTDRTVRDRALGDWLEARGADLVVLAGFMELLGPDLVRRFANRMVNVHPSLLPAFPGVGAIEQAIEHGVRVTGVTVHYVDEHLDSGPIIMQEALELPYPAPIAETEQRVHDVEHRLLPRAVRLLAAGRVRIDPANPRLVLIDDVD